MKIVERVEKLESVFSAAGYRVENKSFSHTGPASEDDGEEIILVSLSTDNPRTRLIVAEYLPQQEELYCPRWFAEKFRAEITAYEKGIDEEVIVYLQDEYYVEEAPLWRKIFKFLFF